MIDLCQTCMQRKNKTCPLDPPDIVYFCDEYIHPEDPNQQHIWGQEEKDLEHG